MAFPAGTFAEGEDIDSGLREALSRLGGESFSFLIEAIGARYEPLQAQRPVGSLLHPSDFTSSYLHDPVNDRMRLSWQRSILEPLTDRVVYDEIVVGHEGYITGADIALHARPARPMEPDRLAAVRRQQQLIHPHLLVGDALRRQRETGQSVIRDAGEEDFDGVTYRVVEISALPRPIRLFMSPAGGQVSHLVTQENDFPCGDVEIVVAFTDWRRVDYYEFPYNVELSRDGVVIRTETRQRIELSPRFDPDTFLLPATVPFDPVVAERGLISEQWIHRATGMGAPISLHSEEVVPVQISPDVVCLGGGIHHSLAVALDCAVVVIDPPQHEERSLAVIKAVRAIWPDKPIKHLGDR